MMNYPALLRDDICDTGLSLSLPAVAPATATSAGREDHRRPADSLSSDEAHGVVSHRAGEKEEEEEEGGARKKLRLTREQSAMLEDRFKENSSPTPKQKQALAEQLNLRPRQVEVWFQNRKARTKSKQTEEDRRFLKKYFEMLNNENQRLQRELREMKAIKFSSNSASPPPPLFIETPAAALAMCPSCGRRTGPIF